jgi:hypothetical protein
MSGDIPNKALTQRPFSALSEQLIRLSQAGGDAGVEGILQAVLTHFGAMLLDSFQSKRFQPMHAIDDLELHRAIRAAHTIQR